MMRVMRTQSAASSGVNLGMKIRTYHGAKIAPSTIAKPRTQTITVRMTDRARSPSASLPLSR